jgi:hypothetical protein
MNSMKSMVADQSFTPPRDAAMRPALCNRAGDFSQNGDGFCIPLREMVASNPVKLRTPGFKIRQQPDMG